LFLQHTGVNIHVHALNRLNHAALTLEETGNVLALFASRAIASAETGLADLRVFFIQSDLFFRGLPERNQVLNLALAVFPDFNDD
jgi:hypothetical protein